MNLFDVYKIILGLVLAGFVIVFAANFLGNYAGVNENTLTYKAMNDFRNSLQNVYTTGNSLEFSKLSQKGIDDCYLSPFSESEPTDIKCGSISMSFYTPVLFTKEKQDGLFLDRSNLDLGWTKFYAVSAVPNMVVIFAPENQATMQTIDDIVGSFSCDYGIDRFSCKSTLSGENTKLKFSICHENDILTLAKSRNDFLSFLETLTIQNYGCNIAPEGTYRIVKLSQNCPDDLEGICIEPAVGNIGRMVVNGNDYFYKDSLDIIAVILGGTEKHPLENKALGIRLLEEKNKCFKEQLLIQIKMERKSISLASVAGSTTECDNLELNFDNSLENIELYLNKPIEDFLTKTNSMSLVDALDDAKIAYNEMVSKGCQ